jgi:hypothetical protein
MQTIAIYFLHQNCTLLNADKCVRELLMLRLDKLVHLINDCMIPQQQVFWMLQMAVIFMWECKKRTFNPSQA